MKGIIGLIVCLCIGALSIGMLLSREAVRDPGRRIAIAFGASRGDRIQIHLGVSPLVIRADPPDVDRANILTWTEWIEAHYQLHDVSGKPIQLMRMGTSGLLMGQKAAGAPEFAVWAELTAGESYTFDFVPILAKMNRYRYAFTAPTEEEKARRRTFELVPEESS